MIYKIVKYEYYCNTKPTKTSHYMPNQTREGGRTVGSGRVATIVE